MRGILERVSPALPFMSKEISTMTGARGDVLVSQFFGGDKVGLCVQISQGHSFVQLTPIEARGLAKSLLGWADTVPAKTLETRWFTFGQCHTHSVAGVTYDKDCVVKITAFSARKVMFETFGPKWAMEYSEEPDLKWFPRGVFEL
jgi:hypothetical protein